jgi:hypothetical protein
MNLRAFAFICIYAGSNAMKPLRRATPLGEKQYHPFRLSFHASLKIGFRKSRVASDGGLIQVRELVKHAHNDWLPFMERHLTRRLFASMLGRIAPLPVPTG